MSAGAAAQRPRQPFAPTLILAVSAALGAMFLLIPLGFVLHPSTHLPGILAQAGDQNQSVKTALYAGAYLVVLPGSVLAALRGADWIVARFDAPALALCATLLALALPAAIILARICAVLPWGGTVGVVLAVACGWWVVVALALVVLSRRSVGATSRPRLQQALSILAAALTLGTVLCVTSLRALNMPIVIVGVVAVLVILLGHGRVALPRLGRPAGVSVDVIVIVLLLLAIPDVVIFKARTPLLTAINNSAIQGQENYLLGPANQLLAGGTMLVDTVSQYGVGSIYFLAGWFHLAPIGYGTLGFLDGLLNALVFAAGYGVLRLAGASQLVAISTIAVGLVALLYNLTFPVGALAEHGPLRFGLPIAAVLAATAATRLPRGRLATGATAAAGTVLAMASIWSIEAFAYTAVTLAAMGAAWTLALPVRARRRWLLRKALFAAAFCVCAQLILAGATLAATGSLPHWGQYFTYFNAFLFGSVADRTYGFARWSPGLAVAAVYLASAIALALIAARRRDWLARRPVPFVALAGTTAYGIALFSYFDNRSATYLLPYVSFPALLTAALWLVVAMPSADVAMRWAGRYIVAFVLALVTIVVAASWHSVSQRLPDSALAHVVPGGPSLGSALHRLWHPPPLDPRAPAANRLLARYIPGSGRALVLLPDAADLEVEVLVRARRGNVLPLGDPIEDSIVPSARLSLLREAIARLRPGDRILTNSSGLRLLAFVRSHPRYDPLAAPHPEYTGKLQEWALKEIAARDQLRPIATDSEGFVVAELMPRSLT